MKFCVYLFISLCFFQMLFAEDIHGYQPDQENEETVATRDFVRKELEALQTRLNEAESRKLEALQTRLQEAESRKLEALQKRLHEAESRIKEQDAKIETLTENKRKTSRASKRYLLNEAVSPVGFTACVSVPDLVSLGDKHTILFDRAITNTGGAYHSHTGVFIAPFKGLYAFHLSAMSSPGKAQYLAFVKDGAVISNVFPDGTGTQTFQTAGKQWIVELDKGSEVWIQTSLAGEIHGNCYTSFSGFLLSEME